MKKKIVSILLACTMAVTLAACGDEAATTQPSDNGTTQSTENK